MGTNVFLQQRKLQSFDKNIAEKIPIDKCFSQSRHSTQVYSKEQLSENPESNVSNSNDVGFKMEPTIETNTKRKHVIKGE